MGPSSTVCLPRQELFSKKNKSFSIGIWNTIKNFESDTIPFGNFPSNLKKLICLFAGAVSWKARKSRRRMLDGLPTWCEIYQRWLNLRKFCSLTPIFKKMPNHSPEHHLFKLAMLWSVNWSLYLRLDTKWKTFWD